jgi:hypothetical protein
MQLLYSSWPDLEHALKVSRPSYTPADSSAGNILPEVLQYFHKLSSLISATFNWTKTALALRIRTGELRSCGENHIHRHMLYASDAIAATRISGKVTLIVNNQYMKGTSRYHTKIKPAACGKYALSVLT